MVALECVRLVRLQFSFSNPDVIPPSIRHWHWETPREGVDRKSRAIGELVIAPTVNVSVAEFPTELEAANYELVDARYEERIHQRDPKRTYHMVRFVFAPREFVNISDEFRNSRSAIRADLQVMCNEALWRVRVFKNPFFKNGEEVPDQRVASVHFEVRRPMPLKPDYRLSIVSGVVTLEEFREDFSSQSNGSEAKPPLAVLESSEMFQALLEVIVNFKSRTDGAAEEEDYLFTVLNLLARDAQQPRSLGQIVGMFRRKHSQVLHEWKRRGFANAHLWGVIDALVRKALLRQGAEGYILDRNLIEEVIKVRDV